MFNTQERQHFLDKFKNKNPSYYTEQPTSKLNRWDYLYILSKVNNQNLTDKQNTSLKRTIDKENAECTFSPKTNQRKVNHIKSNMNFLERSQAWKNKKESIILQKQQEKSDKLSQQEKLFFQPNQIRQVNQNQNSSCLNKSASSLSLSQINHPSSYFNFYSRNVINRKNKEKEKSALMKRPGSGLLYSGKPTQIKEYTFRTSHRQQRQKSRERIKNDNTYNSISKFISSNLNDEDDFESSYFPNNSHIRRNDYVINITPKVISSPIINKNESDLAKFLTLDEDRATSLKVRKFLQFNDAIVHLHNEIQSLDI